MSFVCVFKKPSGHDLQAGWPEGFFRHRQVFEEQRKEEHVVLDVAQLRTVSMEEFPVLHGLHNQHLNTHGIQKLKMGNWFKT
jgi:hypothetical protein